MTTDCSTVEAGACPVDVGAWHYGGYHYDDVGEALVGGLLGFCLCGQPELVAEAMADYLRIIARRVSEAPGGWLAADEALDARFPDPTLRYLVEYEADRVELTEHGGSVGGAWLTDRGRAWLADLTPPPATEEESG